MLSLLLLGPPWPRHHQDDRRALSRTSGTRGPRARYAVEHEQRPGDRARPCVVYPGEPGSFAEDAALAYFGDAAPIEFGQAHDVVALTSSTARARAQALKAQISAATSRYVALCRAAGIPVRDIAFLLGITPQRVSQIGLKDDD